MGRKEPLIAKTTCGAAVTQRSKSKITWEEVRNVIDTLLILSRFLLCLFCSKAQSFLFRCGHSELWMLSFTHVNHTPSREGTVQGRLSNPACN